MKDFDIIMICYFCLYVQMKRIFDKLFHRDCNKSQSTNQSNNNIHYMPEYIFKSDVFGLCKHDDNNNKQWITEEDLTEDEQLIIQLAIGDNNTIHHMFQPVKEGHKFTVVLSNHRVEEVLLEKLDEDGLYAVIGICGRTIIKIEC